MLIESISDIEALREGGEVECKLAAGVDGRGEVPRSLWETYSAFSNSSGGYIILGVDETNSGFRLGNGIINTAKVRSDFFSLQNNQQKISCSLVSHDDYQECSIDGKTVVLIRIRQASRRDRPVYCGGNPLTGTYHRLDEGDQRCSRDKIQRLLAEQEDGARDDRILMGFNFNDLSENSISVYRNLLQARSPTHPFLEGSLSDFLVKIRAWRRDRETGAEGLTVAGLLMFGTSESIRDEFPNYALDYQERDDKRADRWIDRITIDGTWSGNIFDFYRLSWRKLTSELRVPFHLVDGQRLDETPIHEALREALVNSLVHADYTCRASVLIVKRPDMFGFRNPGGMRVPIETAIRGGESDGRNRNLQQMFLLIGAGERAGSGLPKIHQGWRDQHWRPPVLYEKAEPSEQTLLELRMEDLLPPNVIGALRGKFGVQFESLGSDERIILVTAAVEQTVSHTRAMAVCDIHPSDLTRLLQGLVQSGFLIKVGQGRGSLYHLVGANLPDPDAPFVTAARHAVEGVESEPSELSTQPSDLIIEPSDLESEPGGLEPGAIRQTSSDARGGRWITGLDLPVIDNLDVIDPEIVARLRRIAAPAGHGRLKTDVVDDILVRMCAEHYISLKVISIIIGRAEVYLRQNYLNRLVATGRIRRAFPAKPNDPRQAYSTQP